MKRGFIERDDKIYRTTPMGLDLLANLTDIASMISLDLDTGLPSDPE